jgi:hypothetical protein
MKKSELRRMIQEEVSKLRESNGGWSNQESRGAFSWISSDQSSYKKAMKMSSGKDLAKVFGKIVKTEDDIDPKKVNWDEVYDAIQDEG